MSAARFWLASAAVPLAVVLSRTLLLLDMPLNDNEAAAAVIGRFVAGGARMYVDLCEIKPPGMFLPYLLLEHAGALTQTGVRHLATAHAAATAWLLVGIGAQLATRRVGVVAGALYSVYALDPATASYAANADLLMQPFVAAGWLLCLRARGSGSAVAAALAGCALSYAAGVKQTGAIMLLAAAAPLVRRRPALALPMAAGAAASQLFLYIAAGRPPLADYTFWLVSANLTYISDGWHWLAESGATALPPQWGWALRGHAFLAFLVLYAFARRGGAHQIAWRVATRWLAAGAASLLVSGWSYTYWLHQALPPACAVAALARPAIPRGTLLKLAAAVALAVNLAYVLPRWYARIAGSDGAAESPGGTGAGPMDARRVGGWIAERAAPEDRLFVAGNAPQIYWHAGLRPATPHLWQAVVDQIPGVRPEVERRLHARPPEWIVVVREQRGRKTDSLKALLAQGYSGAISFAGPLTVDVWRRAAGGGTGSAP